ncbi:NADP-dependent isopropanol dehydrogenase [Rubripirellula lacrimiformis]|uniref:NADP-dependent isopropanol dehydrogenase n=2 Tax=Rubripirellula lacrimiformis TaxID=1930273 RepID=A0A517N4U4_9BACT|nr:NADP-dependent isopropanol dehydrogenase [Rubripirellula lacrimiformis]
MAKMMKAFVMEGIGKVGFTDKPIPEPGPNDAIVKTTRALVCTSDVHTLKGAIGDRTNLTLGHEAVGVVAKLGSEVRGFQEGDRVAVNAITPCFHCQNCQRGYTSQCEDMLGGWKFANTKDGNFAEYFHVNDASANLTPIPHSISDDTAVYACDMMSTGFMGAEHANIPLGGTVVIFAQGPVGLMATVGARLLGAGLVIGVDGVAKRLEMSRHFGADVTLDYTQVDPLEEIRKLTGGVGVDSAIECLGGQTTFEACVKATRPGGTISVAGYFGHGDSVDIPRVEWGVGMSDKVIRTGLCPGGNVRMSRLLGLIERGRVDPSPLTTHKFAFDDVDKALHLMETKEDGVLKPLIVFNE